MIASPAFIVMKAAYEFRDKMTAPTFRRARFYRFIVYQLGLRQK
jgi:hypothetical protein